MKLLLLSLSIALAFIISTSTVEGRHHHRHRRQSLPPPDALEIKVEGRDVTLNWNFPSQYNNRVQFEIRYRQRGSQQWQNVNTRLKEYRVPGLQPGATYEFQVMAVTAQGNRAPSATMEIRIPEARSGAIVNTRTGSNQAGGFVSANASPSYRTTPTTMHVRVRADEPNVLLLDWDIPQASRPFITGYTVHYSKNPNSISWTRYEVQGSKPEAAIRGLETDSKYFAKVEIRYRDNLPPVTSNVFEFRTPPVQPIRSVKFSNSPDNKLKLEWFLNVDPRTVARTEILWSKTRDLPESQWQRVYAEGQATTAILPEQIRTGAIYFVKLFLTTTDGRVLRSPTIFEIEVQGFQPVLQPNLRTIDYNLKYEVLNHNNLRVSWTFPQAQQRDLINTVISYSDSRAKPESQWRTVTIPRTSATTTLTGLDLRREWWIRIKPVTRGGTLPEMTYRITPVQMTVPQASIGCPTNTGLGVNSAPCTQQRLCLKSCTITRGVTNYECGSDEVCVPSCPYNLIASCHQGWCMARDLVKSAGAQRLSRRVRRAMKH